LCSIFFAILYGHTVLTADRIKELVVSYKYPDAEVAFTVTQDMSGDVNMWYDLADVKINRKRYVENVDPDIIKTMKGLGEKTCQNAQGKIDATWRRVVLEETFRTAIGGSYSSPDKFSYLIARLPGSTLRPCGLQSISMFTDEYELYSEGNGQMVRLPLDESDIVMDNDRDIFKDKISSFNATHLNIGGHLSWLQDGSFYDHFKVWLRSPASPHVIQLWAVIRGGLKQGSYRLLFTQNSAIWTAPGGWGLDEKKVIFSTQNVLGSKGACTALSYFCLVIAITEAIFAMILCFSPKEGLFLPEKSNMETE